MGTVRSYALVLLIHNKHPKTMCEVIYFGCVTYNKHPKTSCEEAKVIYFGCVIFNKHPKTSCQAAKVIHMFIMNTQIQ